MPRTHAAARTLPWLVAASFLVLPVWSTPLRAEPIAVVVSADWPGEERIDLPTLRRLFLGRQTTVEGRRVNVFQRADGSALREAFTRWALRRSPQELERYWIEQALLGGAIPPRERGSAESLLAALRRGSAIGYLGAEELRAAVRENLRILAIDTPSGPRRPGEPDYPLRAPDDAPAEQP